MVKPWLQVSSPPLPPVHALIVISYMVQHSYFSASSARWFSSYFADSRYIRRSYEWITTLEYAVHRIFDSGHMQCEKNRGKSNS